MDPAAVAWEDAHGEGEPPPADSQVVGSFVMLLGHLKSYALSVVTLIVGAPALATNLADGEIVVLEQGNPGGSTGGPAVPASLIGIDPVTGVQTVISSAGLLAPGLPFSFAYDPSSNAFFVVGRDSDLVRIDGSTGAQSLVTSSLPITNAATGIAIEASGDFLVDDFGEQGNLGSLLRVSRDGSTTSVLAQGGDIQAIVPFGLQIDQNGNAVVSGFSSLSGPVSSVIRINPITGQQTLITSSITGIPRGFAISGNSAYISVGSLDSTSQMDQVDKLDLTTGQLTTVYGGLGRVVDVAMDSQGRLVILDQCELVSSTCPNPVVYRSNSSGGLDVVSTDGYMFAVGALTIVPEPSSMVLFGLGLTGIAARLGSRRR